MKKVNASGLQSQKKNVRMLYNHHGYDHSLKKCE